MVVCCNCSGNTPYRDCGSPLALCFPHMAFELKTLSTPGLLDKAQFAGVTASCSKLNRISLNVT